MFCQLKAVGFLADVRLYYHFKQRRICTVISPVKLCPSNGVVRCPLLAEKKKVTIYLLSLVPGNGEYQKLRLSQP